MFFAQKLMIFWIPLGAHFVGTHLQRRQLQNELRGEKWLLASEHRCVSELADAFLGVPL
jgi:hypothetical protein